MIVFKWLARLLFPPRCVLCDRVLEDQTDLCKTCRLHAPECPISAAKRNFLDSWLALWYYEDEVRKSLVLYKFCHRRSKVQSYGKLLAMKIQEQHPEGLDLLTWVPVSAIRKLFRGYDQVELLANVVGRELGMEPRRLLKKIRHNPPQSGIVEEAVRRANVLGVYRVTEPQQLPGKRVLLLDDVITTGATAAEAARMLLTAGAKQVHFAAVAAARRMGK
ncbi:MAG: ComF family protein [Oscillospiraceae bacterium]|nr:ComF family protein [Oscillospiraceae bacterium]